MTEKSDSNEWYTQRKDFETWCNHYSIRPTLDAFGRVHSMCIDSLEDAFVDEWVPNYYLSSLTKSSDVYFNPPLGKGMTKKSILRAFEQWQIHNMNILGIVPAGVIARGYFAPIWKLFKEGSGLIDIEPIRPRPCFEYMGQPATEQARNDYIMLFFKKR